MSAGSERNKAMKCVVCGLDMEKSLWIYVCNSCGFECTEQGYFRVERCFPLGVNRITDEWFHLPEGCLLVLKEEQ